MSDTLDILQQRIGAAVGLIEKLRGRVAQLERELEVVQTTPTAPAVSQTSQAEETCAPPGELERLRRERREVRERIRALIKEFDKVTS